MHEDKPRNLVQQSTYSDPVSNDEEIHSWRPSHLFMTFILGLVAVLLAFVVLVGIVVGWTTIKAIAPYAAIAMLIVGIGITVLYVFRDFGFELLLKVLAVQEKRAQIARDQERHETDLHLAVSRLPADERGNRAHIIDPYTQRIIEVASGNMQQAVPHALTWSPHYAYRDTSTRVTEEKKDEPPGLPAPHVPTARDLLQSGYISRELEQGNYVLGVTDDGEFHRLPHKKLFSSLVAGIPRVGKSTTVFWILAQVILRGGKFFVIDPNMYYESEDGDRGLASELQELAEHMLFPACEGTKQDLLDRTRWMYRELQKRKRPGYIVKSAETVLAIIDEFNSVARMLPPKIEVVKHEGEPLTFAQTVALLEREGPKYGLCFMLIGHKWTKDDIGGDNAVRTNATSYLCHKMNDAGQAELLLKGKSKDILALPVGAYMAIGAQFGTATRVYTPMISAHDIPLIQDILGRRVVESEPADEWFPHSDEVVPDQFPGGSQVVPDTTNNHNNEEWFPQGGKQPELDSVKLALLRQMVLKGTSQNETVEAVFPGMRKAEATTEYRRYLAALID